MEAEFINPLFTAAFHFESLTMQSILRSKRAMHQSVSKKTSSVDERSMPACASAAPTITRISLRFSLSFPLSKPMAQGVRAREQQTVSKKTKRRTQDHATTETVAQ